MKTTVERMYVESLEEAMSHIKLPESMNQVNRITGRKYRRLNNLILASKALENGYTSNEWITKEQLKDTNFEPKEKEFGTQLYSYSIKDTDRVRINQETGETIVIKEKVYSYYTVFNICQLQEKTVEKAS